MKINHYSFSFIGCGNLAYRMSLELQKHGHTVNTIYGRDLEKASKLAYILNKSEHSPNSINKETFATTNLEDVLDSDIVILAVTDNSIEGVASLLLEEAKKKSIYPLVLHSSGATSMCVLKTFPEYGVLYPLMTLSITKPVDFRLVPFFLESSSKETGIILQDICYSLNSEYREIDSNERAQLHVSAVYVSNFINYLTGLAFDLSKPNHMFLMPLAIETIRKAFLYEHPSLVQTGPAIRGDIKTINQHLKLLEKYPEHKEVYELLSANIFQKRKKD